MFGTGTGARTELIARGSCSKAEGRTGHPGKRARRRLRRKAESEPAKQQSAASGKDRQAAECGRNGRRGEREPADNSYIEKGEKHKANSVLPKRPRSRGAKTVGGKRGLNAGAQGREEKAGALPKQNERIGRPAEQRAGPIVKQALGPIRLLFDA